MRELANIHIMDEFTCESVWHWQTTVRTRRLKFAYRKCVMYSVMCWAGRPDRDTTINEHAHASLVSPSVGCVDAGVRACVFVRVPLRSRRRRQTTRAGAMKLCTALARCREIEHHRRCGRLSKRERQRAPHCAVWIVRARMSGCAHQRHTTLHMNDITYNTIY